MEVPDHVVIALRQNHTRFIKFSMLPSELARCTWCRANIGSELKWCSKECRQAAGKLISNTRQFVWEKDGGKCWQCSKDLKADQAERDRVWRLNCEMARFASWRKRSCVPAMAARLIDMEKDFNIALADHPEWFDKPKGRYEDDILVPMMTHRHAYEIDHAIPLHAGGWTGPDNIFLMCIECHQAKSKREAKARASQRRQQKDKPIKFKKKWPSRTFWNPKKQKGEE